MLRTRSLPLRFSHVEQGLRLQACVCSAISNLRAQRMAELSPRLWDKMLHTLPPLVGQQDMIRDHMDPLLPVTYECLS